MEHKAFLDLLFVLIGFHFLADYPLQGPYLSALKNGRGDDARWLGPHPWIHGLVSHSAIHGLFVGLATGSLALGGLMAGMAILTRTELLLVVLGGLFAAVTLQRIIQYTWFKYTRITTGTGNLDGHQPQSAARARFELASAVDHMRSRFAESGLDLCVEGRERVVPLFS